MPKLDSICMLRHMFATYNSTFRCHIISKLLHFTFYYFYYLSENYIVLMNDDIKTLYSALKYKGYLSVC